MNHIWAISPNTGKRLSAVSGKTAVVMPTIVPSQKNVFSVKAKQVVFTALLSWMENIVGLEWFLETAWPKVRKAVPNAELVVSGQMGDQKLKENLAKIPGVKLVGFVPSLADLYHNSAVAIAPILINSGIKVKILTYLSFGLPVVSTTQATWGMDSLDGVKAVKETRFADAVIQLLKNPRERQKLSKAGHANIAHHHSDLALTHFFKKVGVLPGREPKK